MSLREEHDPPHSLLLPALEQGHDHVHHPLTPSKWDH
jgi:hypothetical protein